MVHLFKHVATAWARARDETWTLVANLLDERRLA
jgi:hypothetical protein